MKRLDEGVCPADYYSKAEIARYEGIPADKMAKYARDTLELLEKMCPALGFESLEQLAPYYNTAKNGLCEDKQVNFFLWHTRLAPFAHLFRLFVRRRKAAKGGAVHLYANFGIRKSYYDAFKQNGSLPPVRNRGRLPKHGLESTREKRTAVQFKGGGRVDIPLNADYARFKAGIDACNTGSRAKVTVPEMVLEALREYMEKRPALFGGAQLDCGNKIVQRDNTSLYIENLSPELVRQMYSFIQRYNAAGNQPITMSRFVELAVWAHLERMPLEYL